MNLWIRMAIMLLTLRSRGTARARDETTMHFRVWPHDLDFNWHLTSSRYSAFADVARMDWVLRTKAYRGMRQHRAQPVLSDIACRYRKELSPFQGFAVQTRIVGWDEKCFYFEHRFVREARVVAVVMARAVFRSKDGPVNPALIVPGIGLDPVSPPLPTGVDDWSRSCDALAERIRAEERRDGRGTAA